MTAAIREPAGERLFARLQVHESDGTETVAQCRSIALFQRGTGEHQVPAAVEGCGADGVERREPWRAVGVGQRDAGTHFRDGGRRVNVVAVNEWPALGLCKRAADSGLARACRSYDDDDHIAILNRVGNLTRLQRTEVTE